MTDILTRREVSEKFKIPMGTIDYLISTGQIPFSRIGKRGIRFSLERLEEWLRERENVEYRHKTTKQD